MLPVLPPLSPPGVVTKMKMQRTIVIRRDYLHYIRKYNRFEKRHKNMSVHLSPCFRCVQQPWWQEGAVSSMHITADVLSASQAGGVRAVLSPGCAEVGERVGLGGTVLFLLLTWNLFAGGDV